MIQIISKYGVQNKKIYYSIIIDINNIICEKISI